MAVERGVARISTGLPSSTQARSSAGCGRDRPPGRAPPGRTRNGTTKRAKRFGAHLQVERLIQHFAQSRQKAEPLYRLLGGGARGLFAARRRPARPPGAGSAAACGAAGRTLLTFERRTLGSYRRQNIVDGPQRIASRRVHLVRIRRDEDDRRVGRLLVVCGRSSAVSGRPSRAC